MVPVEELIAKVEGSPVADHVYDGVPPVAFTVALYAAFDTPLGSGELVVIVRAGTMVSINWAVAVWCVGKVESVTVTLTVYVLEVVTLGVPLMTPVLGLIDIVEGSPVADHVYDGVPPVALTVALYATFDTPLGSVAVVMVTPLTTFKVNCADAVWLIGDVTSVTVTLTV